MFKFNEIESLSYHNKEIKFYTPTKKTAGRVKKIFRKEPITITWMDNMKPGEIVIDIGANVGMYSLMSSVSRGTKVYAFEPEASNYNILCQNIRLNNVGDRVTAYCAGNLDYDGFSVLNIAQDRDVGPGGSCHTVEEEKNFDLTNMRVAFKQGINTVMLDTFCKQMNIIPDHIKMDVDGLEHRVINGGVESIQKAKTVIIELNTNLKEHNDAVSKMKSLGFRLDETQVKQALRKGGTFLNVGEHLFYK
jgi:FkbM family methyltransferase